MNLKNILSSVFSNAIDITRFDKGFRNILIFFMILVILFTFFQYVHDVSKMLITADFRDFGYYYGITTIIKEGGDPYDKEVLLKYNQIFEFSWNLWIPDYSPFFFILMRPLIYLSYPSARVVWLILNQLFLLFSVIFFIRSFKNNVSILEFTVITYLVCNFFPLLWHLEAGQVDLLILLFFSGAFYFFKKKRDILSGALLALSILIKPTFGLVLIFYLLKRRYKIILSTILTYGTLTAISILFVGIKQHIDYFNLLLHYFSTLKPLWLYLHNVSVGGLFYRLFTESPCTTPLFHSPTTAAVLAILASLILLGISILIWKKKTPQTICRINLEFSLAVVTLLLISPLVERHHYVFLFLPYISILHFFTKSKIHYLLMGGLAVSYVILGSNFYLTRFAIFNSGILSIFLIPQVYGVLLLWGILVYILHKDSENLS